MRELYFQEPIPVEEIDINEDRKVGCVPNTIVSICSAISGINFSVPDAYYQLRGMMLKDMSRMQAMRRREKPHETREHLEAAAIKLDQRAFVKFLDSAREGRGLPFEASLIQTVLQDIDIEYRKGGLEEMEKDIDAGRQVAATFKVTDDRTGKLVWHIAHIGRDRNGFVSHSDGNIPLATADLEEIDLAADFLNISVRTWNFVSVGKIGDQ